MGIGAYELEQTTMEFSKGGGRIFWIRSFHSIIENHI